MTTRSMRSITGALAVLVALSASACGASQAVESSGTSGASSPDAEPSPEVVDLAARLAEKVDQLVQACDAQGGDAKESTPPTTTPEGVASVNGFKPYVGPGCTIGYIAADRQGPPEENLLAVREQPSNDSAIVGYVVGGMPGWLTPEEAKSIDSADLSAAVALLNSRNSQGR
jgi:hypothetical protein